MKFSVNDVFDVSRCKYAIHFAIMQEKEQNISPIKQRILQFVDTLSISKREFYAKIGVSRGTLESKTGITEDVMAKFIAEYDQVSLIWLITGEGEMLKTSEPAIIQSDTSVCDWMKDMLISQQKTIENLSKTIAELSGKQDG